MNPSTLRKRWRDNGKAVRQCVRFPAFYFVNDCVKPVNGNRHFEARLQRFEEGKLILETIPGKKKPKPGHAQPVQQFEIDLANVEKANLVPEI